jgi:hypothetical protein
MNIENGVYLPFTGTRYHGGHLIAIGARPQMGRTLYTLQIIKEYTHCEDCGIAKPWCFFVDTPPSIFQLIDEKELNKVNYCFIEHSRHVDKFVKGLKTFLNEKPGFVLIHKFEKLFDLYSTPEDGLLAQPLFLLRELSNLVREYQIPIVLTTNILNTSEDNLAGKKPMLKDFQSDLFDRFCTHVYALHRPAVYGYSEDENGQDITNTVELIHLVGKHPSDKEISFVLDPVSLKLYEKGPVADRILRITRMNPGPYRNNWVE